MKRVMELLEKYLAPLAQKIEDQRHVQALKNGMLALVSVLIVGSFTLVLNSLLGFFPEGTILKQISIDYGYYLNLPFNFTFGFLALYAAIAIGYNYSPVMKVPTTHGIIGAVLTTLIINVKIVDGIADTAYLDSRGLFTAIIASMLAIEIMSLFIRKKWTMNFTGMPNKLIANTFEAIIPLVFVLSGALLLNIILMENFNGQILPELFTTFLTPLVNGVDSVWFVMIFAMAEMLFWFVGLNGYAILMGFVMPFLTANMAENAAAYQMGLEIPNVFVPNFWDYFMAATGSGITGSLVILACFSKVRSINAVGKASILPAIFTISEPMVYGLPIAFNPYLFIPFVFGTPLIAGASYMVFEWGFVRPSVVHVGGTPVPLAQYLSTMDPRAVILFIAIIAAGCVMYYPFFKMYEKSVAEKDAMIDERQDEFDELGLDF